MKLRISKTNYPLFFILILSITISSCSNEIDTPMDSQIGMIELPDFRAIHLNEGNSDEESRGKEGYVIKTESDLVGGGSDGCWTVNVRVYSINKDTGQSFLLANDNVLVGDGCTKTNKNNAVCSGILKDGNYVYMNGTDAHICLYELLTKNEVAYKQYTVSINKLLNN